MSKLELIRAFYDYNEHANNRVLEAASRLSAEAFSRPQGASFDSVEGNLAHIRAAQVVWLERWKGGSDPRPLAEVQSVRGLAEIREAFADSHADLREFLGGRRVDRLDRVLAYRDSRGDSYERVLWQLMLHVGNHGSYHRAETAMALTAMGQNPGDLDYSYFEMARDARPAGDS
jgi:uncharacterized damage-inducible protein DinB